MTSSFDEFKDHLIDELRNAHARAPRLVVGLVGVFAVTSVLLLAGSIWAAVELVQMRHDLPGQEAIGRIGELDQATAVFDDHDELAFTIYKEQRIDVPLNQVSPHLLRAILAIEDQRFYKHHGFDVVRIVSAALTNIRHGRAAQGGSTITQQLARQSFLVPDKTLRRKLQELILADRIESQYTKAQILELYLNKVYFGDGLHGIEAASRGYFNKHASELSIPEAALLAGLVKSPSAYAPTVSLKRAVARRDVVLAAMLQTGAIDRAQYEQAKASQVALQDGLGETDPHGEYFREQVRLELVQRFGWQRVYQGGLRVFTTMNMPMQIAAEKAVAEAIKPLDDRRLALLKRRAAQRKKPVVPDSEPLQAALVALDPANGHVRAMVGGRDFAQSKFNRAMQARRQTGSAFKPFVYAAALESGYSPATMIEPLDEAIATPQGAWLPDDGHAGNGPMSLRAGLRMSSNRAAVELLQEVGIPRTVEYAKQMGVGDVPSVPSLALGSGEVTLASMTAAYAAFANQGRVPRIVLIRRVEDRDGRVLFDQEDQTTQVLSETTAFLMSSMLADVINAGTASRARALGFKLPAAGKTGTTNDFKDAWFVGYTPHLVAGVWVGFDQPQTILPNGFAADLAVPMWTAFMKAATADAKPDWYRPPSGVTTASVCRLSGKLATEGCQHVEVAVDGRLERQSMVYTEYFARNTVPTEYCDLHQSQSIFSKIASLLGHDGGKPLPPRIAEVDPAAAQPAAEPAPVASAGPDVPPTVEKKKKRGFWSKLFGIGGNDDDKSNGDQDDKRRPKKR